MPEAPVRELAAAVEARDKNTHRITASHYPCMRAPVVEAQLGARMSPPGLVKCLQLAGNASASLCPHTAPP